MVSLRLSLFGALLVLAACDTAPAGGPDGGADGGLDGGGDGGWEEGPAPCVSWPSGSDVFALDPSGPLGHVSVSTASDGRHLWAAFARPDGETESGTDIELVRVGCDGTPDAPVRASTQKGPKQFSPALAVGAQGLIAAWHADNDDQPNNLTIRFRLFTANGLPRGDSALVLRSRYRGEASTGNAMMPAVAALPDGFAVAGIRALDDRPGFHAFVQRLDPAGTPRGDAVDAAYDDEDGASYPDVAATASGRILLAWNGSAGGPGVRRISVPPGFDLPSPLDPAGPFENRRGGQDPSIAAERGGERAYLALVAGEAGGSSILVRDATVMQGEVNHLVLGEAGRRDLLASIAASSTGGAVAWLRNFDDGQVLLAQSFTYQGGEFTPGLVVALRETDVSYRRPSITHLSGNTYFVAWIEGTWPEHRAMGRFVTLE